MSIWVTGSKNVFGIVGVLIGSLVAAPLFETLGPVAMGVVVGVVGLGTIWLTLLGLRDVERPLGVRVAFLTMAASILVGAWILRAYRLGDTPAETRRSMSLDLER